MAVKKKTKQKKQYFPPNFTFLTLLQNFDFQLWAWVF